MGRGTLTWRECTNNWLLPGSVEYSVHAVVVLPCVSHMYGNVTLPKVSQAFESAYFNRGMDHELISQYRVLPLGPSGCTDITMFIVNVGQRTASLLIGFGFDFIYWKLMLFLDGSRGRCPYLCINYHLRSCRCYPTLCRRFHIILHYQRWIRHQINPIWPFCSSKYSFIYVYHLETWGLQSFTWIGRVVGTFSRDFQMLYFTQTKYQGVNFPHESIHIQLKVIKRWKLSYFTWWIIPFLDCNFSDFFALTQIRTSG